MSEQQPEASEQSSGSGGSSWWKWLLGCGCLGFLLLTCSGVAGVLYSSYVVKSVYDNVREGVEVRAEVVEQRQKAIEGGDIAVDLEQPLTADDYETFGETVEGWKQTEPFQEIKSLAETEEAQSDSFVEQLRVMYKLWKSAAALQQLGTHYIETIESHGGIETHYNRLLRIGAVVAAAHEVATNHRFDKPGDPTSDAVATLLTDEHDATVEAYGSKIDQLRSGTHSFEKLVQRGELGVFALATLPTESYEPWANYSEEERDKLVEHFGWSVVAESLTFGGFAFPVAFNQGLPVGK